jgi:hypothetical protein
MDRQKLGYLGGGLLVAGLFLPIVTLPIVGNVTLMANGTNLAALSLLILAGISTVLVAKDRQSDLIWSAFASAASLIYLFGRLQYSLSHMRSEMAEKLSDNPFAGLAQAAMGAVQIQWGWLILGAGAGILVYLAIQARKEYERPMFQVGEQGGRALFVASLVCFLVAPALDVWGMMRGGASGAEESAGAKAGLAPTGLSSSASKDGDSTMDAERTAYIRDHLKVYDLDAHYFDSILDGRVPGVDFKIKNDGIRTLNKVSVRVVFYDAQDKPIAEEEYSPVFVTSSGIGDNTPLRPNYIWKQEQGNFYAAKSVPSEWKTGKVTATIIEIEFGPNE